MLRAPLSAKHHGQGLVSSDGRQQLMVGKAGPAITQAQKAATCSTSSKAADAQKVRLLTTLSGHAAWMRQCRQPANLFSL